MVDTALHYLCNVNLNMFASPPTLFIMKQIIGQKLLNDRNSIQNFIFVAGVFNFGQFMKRIRVELSQ